MATKKSGQTGKAKQSTKKATDTASEAQEATSEVQDTATETTQDAAQSAGGETNGIFSELKDTARDAALDVLKPVIKEAAQSAAQYAATKGPELLKDKVGDLADGDGLKDLANKGLSQGGPLAKVAGKLGVGGKLVDSVMPDGDDDEDEDGGEADGDATGSGRRMPVQLGMNVAVPLEVAYNQWTQFEEYPNFMHRVDSVEQEDEGHVNFTEKMWNFTRTFEAEIIDQRPNERIAWRSVNGLKHAGVVTFHELAPRLTRIEVTVDFKPEGFFEKIGRGARFSKRAIRADMHRFKAYVEMQEEEDGAWRGYVEDGEVTGYEESEEQQDEAEGEEEPEAEGQEDPEAEAEEDIEEEPDEDEELDEEELEAEEDEEPEAEVEDDEEPEVEEDEEPEAEVEDDEEPDAEEEPEAEAEEEPEAKPQRQRRKTSANGGSGQSRSRSKAKSQSKSQPKSKSKSGNGGAPRRRPSSPRKPKTASR